MKTDEAMIQKGATIPFHIFEDDLKAMVARRWGIAPDSILSIKAENNTLYLALKQEPMIERKQS